MPKQIKRRFSAAFAVGAVCLGLFVCMLATLSYCLALILPANKMTGAGTSSSRSLPIYSVQTEEKKVAISFDCAWGVDYTDKILQALDDYGVKCTFFAVEFWVEKYPEYVKKIVERGHEIGTHSKTHPHMSKLDRAGVLEELSSSVATIEALTNQKVTLFRPPFGEYDNKLINCAKSLGLYTIQWDVDSLDWKNLSAAEITSRVLKKVKSGSIILCHNNGLHTYEALPGIFATLIGQGYRFVPIGDLIYRDGYDIDTTGEQFIL